ncbi:AAA family ATPase [Microbispora sp. NPDC088329]|uniref:AAA family ATPase n=1 Tax=Microbispora sp. NPDC088329 TaxID=3154869 RepID=UPI00342630B7
MITRIEIDGFKSFENFTLDLPPFLVLIGTNASGKSNLLDALTFVATAATEGLNAAVAKVRGDARGLFRRRGDGTRVKLMSFALEFLLSGPDLNSGNRWRYELSLGWEVPEDALEGIVVRAQRLISMPFGTERWDPLLSAAPEWLEGIEWEGSNVIELPAAEALPGPHGVLGLLTAALSGTAKHSQGDVHLLLRLQRELSDIRLLHLEAGALRRPSEMGGPQRMDSTGRDLPNYLRFLAKEGVSDNRPLGRIGEIKMHLVGLVREVSDFMIVEDERRRDVRLEFSSPYERGLGAEFASDGTLRMLAILAALHDRGTTAVEEPENGVFPERLRQLLGLAGALVTNFREPPERDQSGVRLSQRQVLFTSHSPVVLDAVPYENIAFLDMTTVIEDGVPSRVSRVRRLREDAGPVRVAGERWPRVTDSELDRFRAGVEEPV